MSISVVLATHNEEKNLATCLDAVNMFADEIVVVDGESTDHTIDIAKKYNAKVISTTNKQVFHINKQMAMDKASGDLVLQLDADEIVDEELRAFIMQTHKQIMSNSVKELPSAWWIKRKNWFLGKFLTKGGQYPDPVIRLYQKGKAWLPQKDVHEQMEVDGEVGWATGHLLHYGTPTFADYLRKWDTYTSLKATQLDQAKQEMSIWQSFRFFFLMPLSTFFSLFIRHKGVLDGIPGLIFALYSGLYHTMSYLKLWEIRNKASRKTSP